MDFLRDVFTIDRTQLANMLVAVPLLPLLGAIINGFFGRRLGHARAALIATAMVLGSFVVSLAVFANLMRGERPFLNVVYTWFNTGGLDVQLGLFADPLSATLLLVITGVGTLIHWYSSSYMENDEASWRYFAYLNLFVASMLLLVLGDNLVTMFVGWEGVGLCSYLLIGFWFTDTQKASAGRKAFIVNRVGDFAFLIGIFTLFSIFGTTSIPALKRGADEVRARTQIVQGVEQRGFDTTMTEGLWAPEKAPAQVGSQPSQAAQTEGFSFRWVLGLALFCLFLGATGKSAQIPLYVWLPDAMAGPTPVSALIHAATMVTAGVYMIARLSFLYVEVPVVLTVVALVGVATAFFAALMAFAQNDIKKVLAYSTVSQLGFMFIGVGAGAFAAGTFHLFTHALFKACLFLGSGAVIHGLHEEQDIRKMGGLKKYMPHTRWTFLIATITIAGVLPFSGFFSKDEILHLAHHSPVFESVGPWVGNLVYILGSLTALCTAFYMFRLYFLTFEGEYRGDAHPHESPAEMTLPLWILAIASIAAAVLAFPIGHSMWEQWLAPSLTAYPVPLTDPNAGVPWGAFGIALLIGLAGLGIAWAMYGKGLSPAGDPLFTKAPAFAKLSANKFYVDEIYDALIVRPLWSAARWLHAAFDALLIDKIVVLGTARVTALASRLASPFQNGDLSRYAALTAVAIVGLLLWAVL